MVVEVISSNFLYAFGQFIILLIFFFAYSFSQVTMVLLMGRDLFGGIGTIIILQVTPVFTLLRWQTQPMSSSQIQHFQIHHSRIYIQCTTCLHSSQFFYTMNGLCMLEKPFRYQHMLFTNLFVDSCCLFDNFFHQLSL